MHPKIKLFTFLFLFLSYSATADSIYLGMYSWHDEDRYNTSKHEDTCMMGPCRQNKAQFSHKLNDSNDLLAFEHKNYIVGAMTNSFNERTYLAARQFRIYSAYGFSASADIGVSHGYRNCSEQASPESNKKICPIGAIELSIDKMTVSPVLLMTPKTISISFRLKL